MSDSIAGVRRLLLAALVASLVLAGVLFAPPDAGARADFSFDRAAGEDRYATSAQAADRFGSADTVVLVSGEPGRYPDAFSASYLAGLENAPVLLTRHEETPELVVDAIGRTGADAVIIVGGEASVSAAQEFDLAEEYTVSRIAGADRFETAAAVIAEASGTGQDTALLATGMKFPDALGAGALAFAERMPMAITRPHGMPDVVLDQLRETGISKVLVMGGESAVSNSVIRELAGAGISLERRLAGSDRSDTSVRLARYAIANHGFSDTAVNVASGDKQGAGADALSAAALSGQQRRPLLITRSTRDAGSAVLKMLRDHAPTLTEGTLFGGRAIVPTGIANDMLRAAGGAPVQGVGARFPGDPGTDAMYYGASYQGNDDALTRYENSTLGGDRLQPHRFYEQTGAADGIVSRVEDQLARGRLPWVSIKLQNSWRQVAAGAEDARLIAIARGFSELPGPIWFTPHHEPYGDGPGAEYVAMYEHVVTLMRKHDGGRVAYAPILNGQPFEGDTATSRSYIPATEAMDIFGFDLYNAWSPTNGKRWRSFSDRAQHVLEHAPPGVPRAVGEFGVRHDPDDPQRAVRWLQEMYDYTHNNDFVGVSYFNSGANSPDGPWTLDGVRLTKWKELRDHPATAVLP